jgi:hypothetical protein
MARSAGRWSTLAKTCPVLAGGAVVVVSETFPVM